MKKRIKESRKPSKDAQIAWLKSQVAVLQEANVALAQVAQREGKERDKAEASVIDCCAFLRLVGVSFRELSDQDGQRSCGIELGSTARGNWIGRNVDSFLYDRLKALILSPLTKDGIEAMKLP